MLNNNKITIKYLNYNKFKNYIKLVVKLIG